MARDEYKNIPKPKLTDKQEDFIKCWETQIEYALQYRKKYSDIDHWDTYRRWYRGDFRTEQDMDNQKRIAVNKTFAYIRSMVPRTYFRNPSISVTATRPEYIASARMLQLLNQWMVRATHLKKTVKKAILQAGITGTGPIKLGYDSEFGFLPELGIDLNKGTVSQVSVEDGSRIETNANIQPGMPWAMSVRPEEILIPFGYSDPQDLPWIGHIIIRKVCHVHEDQKYDKKFREAVKGGFVLDKTFNPKSATLNLTPNKEDYALLYEIQDFEKGRMYVICEGMPLIDSPNSLQINDLPWEFVIFNEDPEYFWGLSDVRMIAPQQREINEIRSYASVMRKLNVIRMFYQKGIMTPEYLQNFLSKDIEDIGMGIEVETDSIAASIQISNPANVSDNLIREQQQTDADFRDTLGYSANQMGDYSPFHNKTATEANIVQKGADIRGDERRDIVADVVAGIIRRFNQFVFKFWTTDRVMEVTGADGVQYWITFTGAQLAGEYAYVINPEDSQPVDMSTRQEAATNIFQMFDNDPLIDQVGLRELVFDQVSTMDPAYKTLIRIPQQGVVPGMGADNDPERLGAGVDGLPGGGAGMSVQQPPQSINFAQLQQDPMLRKQVLGV